MGVRRGGASMQMRETGQCSPIGMRVNERRIELHGEDQQQYAQGQGFRHAIHAFGRCGGSADHTSIASDRQDSQFKRLSVRRATSFNLDDAMCAWRFKKGPSVNADLTLYPIVRRASGHALTNDSNPAWRMRGRETFLNVTKNPLY